MANAYKDYGVAIVERSSLGRRSHGGADVPVSGVGSVEVVVAVHGRRVQPLALPVREQPEAGAHLDVLILFLDRIDDLRDSVHVLIDWPAAAGHRRRKWGRG